MAIYHLHVKIISKKKGHSIIAAAAYRSGGKLYDKIAHKTHDYSKKSGIVYSNILVPYNSPDWANNREELWNNVNKIEEKRFDAQTARDITLALPKELSKGKQKNLVEEFCQFCFIKIGMVADINIHHDNPNNPHAHILLTMRNLSSKGFSLKKNREWNHKKMLENWREKWTELANKYLNLLIIPINPNNLIDHRTLISQGINEKPQLHVGKNATYAHKKNMKSERAERNEIIKNIKQKTNQPKHINTTIHKNFIKKIKDKKDLIESVSNKPSKETHTKLNLEYQHIREHEENSQSNSINDFDRLKNKP